MRTSRSFMHGLLAGHVRRAEEHHRCQHDRLSASCSGRGTDNRLHTVSSRGQLASSDADRDAANMHCDGSTEQMASSHVSQECVFRAQPWCRGWLQRVTAAIGTGLGRRAFFQLDAG